MPWDYRVQFLPKSAWPVWVFMRCLLPVWVRQQWPSRERGQPARLRSRRHGWRASSIPEGQRASGPVKGGTGSNCAASKTRRLNLGNSELAIGARTAPQRLLTDARSSRRACGLTDPVVPLCGERPLASGLQAAEPNLSRGRRHFGGVLTARRNAETPDCLMLRKERFDITLNPNG